MQFCIFLSDKRTLVVKLGQITVPKHLGC